MFVPVANSLFSSTRKSRYSESSLKNVKILVSTASSKVMYFSQSVPELNMLKGSESSPLRAELFKGSESSHLRAELFKGSESSPLRAELFKGSESSTLRAELFKWSVISFKG